MINNNGHQNAPCTFAEQLAAYLYDETNVKEKINFESHLQSCRTCTDELADFSALRSSISEWRENEFEILETPSIVLPTARQIVAPKHSWAQAIREIFTLSPMRAAAFAAIAVLMISAGVFWFASSRLDHTDLAKSNNIERSKDRIEDIQAPVPAPTVETARIQDKTATVTKRSTAPVRSSDASGKALTPATSKTPLNSPAPNATQSPRLKAPAKNNAPALNTDDDDDDNSLRLSDIFEEIGMKKSADNNTEEDINNE